MENIRSFFTKSFSEGGTTEKFIKNIPAIDPDDTLKRFKVDLASYIHIEFNDLFDSYIGVTNTGIYTISIDSEP